VLVFLVHVFFGFTSVGAAAPPQSRGVHPALLNAANGVDPAAHRYVAPTALRRGEEPIAHLTRTAR
jgi:hypothetical protein